MSVDLSSTSCLFNDLLLLIVRFNVAHILILKEQSWKWWTFYNLTLNVVYFPVCHFFIVVGGAWAPSVKGVNESDNYIGGRGYTVVFKDMLDDKWLQSLIE